MPTATMGEFPCSWFSAMLAILAILNSFTFMEAQEGGETKVKDSSEVPEIATLNQEIYDGDDDRVKVLKKLFNDRNTTGFIQYWETSGLTPNFHDVYGRGFNHWAVGANLVVNDVPWRAIAPIHVYFANNYEAAVEWDMKDVTGHSGLHYSVLYDKQAYVQILLARGASVSVTDPEGKTALHMAVELGLTATTNLLLQGSDRQKPAPTEVLYTTDNIGYTPLHYAAAADFQQLAELLARHAPHPEHYIMYEPAEFRNVSSSFHLAIAKGSLLVVEVFLDLIESTADLLKPDPSGSLPLQIAAMFGHEKIVKLLVDRFRKTDISYACFEDARGRNALHYAARFGHLEVIRIILRRMNQGQKEECIYHPANNDWTPLHFAARYHHNLVLDFFLKISAKGIDAKQDKGLTALQLAAVGCKLKADAAVVKLLIRAGADLGAGSSTSPLEICQDRECPSCVEAIQAAEMPDAGFKYPADCDQPADVPENPFSPSSDRTKTLSGSRDCGVPVVETGRQLCFFVEVIDYTGFEQPSEGFVIGMGVAIDEYVVSVPASMFITVDELFNRKTLLTTGNYAIKSQGRKGAAAGQQTGRYIKVDGSPSVHRAFKPSSSENDLAYLILEDALSEFEDGTCFLCLPAEEVPLGCLSNVCFVISPADASGATSKTAWSRYRPAMLSTAYCAKETATLGVSPSENHICVESASNPIKCGSSSSVMICQRDNIVRLYGHQVYPSASSSLAGDSDQQCSAGKVHGVFTSLQTAAARSFYQTALPPLKF